MFTHAKSGKVNAFFFFFVSTFLMEMSLEVYLVSSWHAGAKYRGCLPFYHICYFYFDFHLEMGDLVILHYRCVRVDIASSVNFVFTF